MLSRFALLTTALIASASAEIIEWEHALNTSNSRVATFTAAASIGPNEGGNGETFICGHFNDSFELPGSPAGTISSSGKNSGVITRMDPSPTSPNWTPVWLTHADSTGLVTIEDVAHVLDSNFVYICGTYNDDINFIAHHPADPPSYTLNHPSSNLQGFAAILKPDTGECIKAFTVQRSDGSPLLPRSIAVDQAGDCYLTGDPVVLASKFDSSGNLLWDLPTSGNIPGNPGELKHIAILPTSKGTFSFVLGSTTISGHGDEVFTSGIAPNGSHQWTKITSSADDDIPGGLDVSPHHVLTFSLATQDPDVHFEGQPLSPPPANPALHTYVVRITPDGKYIWSTLLAEAGPNGGTMTSNDLSHDERGNAHLAVNFTGAFTFESASQYGDHSAALVSVGDSGTPYHFLKSQGPPQAEALGVAATSFQRQALVGHYSGEGNIHFGSHSLPASTSPRAFAAFSNSRPGQKRFVVYQQPGSPIPPADFLRDLRNLLEVNDNAQPPIPSTWGNSYPTIPADIVYTLFHPNLDLINDSGTLLSLNLVGFVAYLNPSDVDNIDNNPDIVVELDPDVHPSGSTTDPSATWNLAKMNDASKTGTSYTYPELCQPVRLYLIDTAVTDPANSYFASNSKLSLRDNSSTYYGELLRGPSDYQGLATSEHGTHLLSLVAGPTHGICQDTPVTTKIYDIYPNAGSAGSAAVVADAIVLSVSDFREHRDHPGLILIASNTVTEVLGGDINYLEYCLDHARLHGVPIVMSAGNEGDNASKYAPAQFGYKNGILCVGSTNSTGSFASSFSTSGGSNYGNEVNILAPGDSTVVIDDTFGPGFTESFTGTSASAALTAGALIQYLSTNPWLNNHDILYDGGTRGFLIDSIQTSLVSDTTDFKPQARAPETRPSCLTAYNDWTEWFGLTALGQDALGDNSDGDPYNNLQEFVLGLNPLTPDPADAAFGIHSTTTSSLTMSFPVAWWLWDESTSLTGTTFTLLDGSTTLAIRTSTNLQTFSDESVTLTPDPSSSCNGQIHFTFEQPTASPTKKFFQLHLHQ